MIDAAGIPVDSMNSAFVNYKQNYQEDFYTFVSDPDNNYNNHVFYCEREDAYFAHAPMKLGDNDVIRLPISVNGTPLFSNLYLENIYLYLGGVDNYPDDYPKNIDAYAVSFQIDGDMLTPAIYFYDFRTGKTGGTYIPALSVHGYTYASHFNEWGLTKERFEAICDNERLPINNFMSSTKNSVLKKEQFTVAT